MGDFRAYLRQKGLSRRSVTVYVRSAMDADAWCRQRGLALTTLSGDSVEEFCASKPHTWASRKLVRGALLHYWSFRRRRDPPLWALRVPRKPRMICRALPEHDAAHLAQAATKERSLPAFAVLLAMYLGLRRFEIASLRWEQFSDDGWLRLVGKNEQAASLPVHPAVLAAIPYVANGSPWCFPGSVDGHVASATIWSWTREFCRHHGISGVTPHRLRHTCLATANDNTGDLRAVQEFARHARPDTTAGYTRATARRLVEVMRALDYAAPHWSSRS